MSAAPDSTAADRIVWIDGSLVRGADAALSIFDRGARDGEGLFETLRIYSGRPFLWERHMERLVVSAAELGFPVPASPAALRQALDQLLDATGLVDAVARVTVTRGIPSRSPGRRARAGSWIEVESLDARLWKGTREKAARAILSRLEFHPGPLGPHKTTSRLAYHLARDEARAARADEALLTAPSEGLLEGSASSVFVVAGGRVATPPLDLGILPGITRGVVLRLCERLAVGVDERRIALRELAEAEEVFLTNSVQEVVPVALLGTRPLPQRAVGLRLGDAYRREVRDVLGLPAVPDDPPGTGN